MRFTVVWKPIAEERLAKLWLQASDRAALTSAADAIDRFLRESPLVSGWPRPDGTRLLIIEPLAIVYEIRPLDRFVFVLDVQQL